MLLMHFSTENNQAAAMPLLSVGSAVQCSAVQCSAVPLAADGEMEPPAEQSPRPTPSRFQ
jgi:hypothetical protein